MNIEKYAITSSEQMQKVGEQFAKSLIGGDLVVLYGDLGFGKTTFTQGIAKGLGIKNRIISPTFVIVRTYALPENNTFYHIDLYRTTTQHDLEGLGLSEILHDQHAITIIEWPDRLEKLPEKRTEVHIDYIDDQNRTIIIRKRS